MGSTDPCCHPQLGSSQGPQHLILAVMPILLTSHKQVPLSHGLHVLPRWAGEVLSAKPLPSA